MRNITAHMSGEATDCDGKHYSEADYPMNEEEKTEEFGDLNFFDRIMSYTVSTHAESGRLNIRQDENGLPVFEWNERTDEGYSHKYVTFEKEPDHED